MHLSDFQWLMRDWAALGPYHALDAMQLDGAGDRAAWQDKVASMLSAHGFAPDAPLREYAHLDTAVAVEMNERFASTAQPFRFFIVPDHGSHWLGLVWNHWVADSVTIRELMHRLHAAWFGATLPPLRHARPPRAGLLTTLATAWRHRRLHRRAYRIPVADPLDLRVGTCTRSLADDLLPKLLAHSRKHGATVNDCFLAALAQTLGEWSAAERANSARNEVALGVAVNTRPLFPQESRDAFGFFLSYFTIVRPSPERVPWAELLRGIAMETRWLKQTRAAIRFDAGWRAVRWWSRANPQPRRRALAPHRGVPCAGSISNVNLDAEWPAAASTLLDYRRFSPCGPLVPMVFVPTTLRGRIVLSVTHRSTVLDAATANALTDAFIQRVTDHAAG